MDARVCLTQSMALPGSPFSLYVAPSNGHALSTSLLDSLPLTGKVRVCVRSRVLCVLSRGDSPPCKVCSGHAANDHVRRDAQHCADPFVHPRC